MPNKKPEDLGTTAYKGSLDTLGHVAQVFFPEPKKPEPVVEVTVPKGTDGKVVKGK
jgi:hypothetical protein